MFSSISQFHNHAQYVEAVCLADSTSCKVEIFFKYDRNIPIIIHFKQYVCSSIQSAVFTGCVARQTNRLYVLRMIVKLAYNTNVSSLNMALSHNYVRNLNIFVCIFVRQTKKEYFRKHGRLTQYSVSSILSNISLYLFLYHYR